MKWLSSWWKNTSKALKIVQITALALGIAFIVSFIGGYFGGWTWTGFGPYTPPTSDYQRGVTLYDWLQLVVVPAAIAFGVVWFTRLQQQHDQQLADQRTQTEREAAEKQAQTEREAAEKRAQTERGIAEDNQREAALKEYYTIMSELLLHEKLRESGQTDEVRTIAHVRTLTALLRLDGRRKGSVVQFLHESGLICKDRKIIDLSRADLTGAELFIANLHEANMSGANLHGADLSDANLHEADLSRAYLRAANLSRTNLSEADLRFASLNFARLSGADLSGANLHGAFDITTEELEKQAKSLKGAIMPDGTTHP